MQDICHRLIEEESPPEELKKYDSTIKGFSNDNWLKNLEVAMALEKIALNDKYFKDWKLFPNVDFYSGIVL